MKKLYRFYCIDCDNAWHDLVEDYENHAKCDYCLNEIEAEQLENEENN
jgi:hypothetical protein